MSATNNTATLLDKDIQIQELEIQLAQVTGMLMQAQLKDGVANLNRLRQEKNKQIEEEKAEKKSAELEVQHVPV